MIQATQEESFYFLIIQVYYLNIKAKELGSIGNSLMKLCLDCIKVWAIWFPFSDYKVAYDELMNEGVQFPVKYTYFKEFNDNPQSLG
jgi:hypothetical protein